MDLYVNKYYSVKKFQAAYHGIIPNITNRDQWPKVDKGFKLLPPLSKKKKPPGRLKKSRYLRDEDDGWDTIGCGPPGRPAGRPAGGVHHDRLWVVLMHA